MIFYIRKETVDQLVSEDHTKPTSIVHWIQVDMILLFLKNSIFISFFFFRVRGKHLRIISQDNTSMMTWMQIPLCEVTEGKLAVILYNIFTGFLNSCPITVIF